MPICAARYCNCFLKMWICAFLFLCSRNECILIRTYYVNRVCMSWQEKQQKDSPRQRQLKKINPCFVIHGRMLQRNALWRILHSHWITMQKFAPHFALHTHMHHVNDSITVLAVTVWIKQSCFLSCHSTFCFVVLALINFTFSYF